MGHHHNSMTKLHLGLCLNKIFIRFSYQTYVARCSECVYSVHCTVCMGQSESFEVDNTIFLLRLKQKLCVERPNVHSFLCSRQSQHAHWHVSDAHRHSTHKNKYNIASRFYKNVGAKREHRGHKFYGIRLYQSDCE